MTVQHNFSFCFRSPPRLQCLLTLLLMDGWQAARGEIIPRSPINGTECLRVLHQRRLSGLPLKITSGDPIEQAMWNWDRASGPDKVQVIEELIIWLPVLVERPEILKEYDFEDLHPAANVLRNVGVEAIAPLEKSLLANPESAQTELMARLLQRLYGRFNDLQNEHLQALKARTTSVRFKAMIDRIDKLTRHPATAVADDEEIVTQP